MTNEVQNAPTVTVAQLISDMTEQFVQIDAFNEVLKQLKATAKAAGHDGALLAKVAKAIADSKVSDLTEKTELLLELLDQNGGN